MPGDLEKDSLAAGEGSRMRQSAASPVRPFQCPPIVPAKPPAAAVAAVVLTVPMHHPSWPIGRGTDFIRFTFSRFRRAARPSRREAPAMRPMKISSSTALWIIFRARA
jgi:hypothetical protein